MTAEAYICLDCELRGVNSSTTLRTDGTCLVCGSKQVLSEAVLLAALRTHKPTASSAASSPSTDGVATLRVASSVDGATLVRETPAARATQARTREQKTLASHVKVPFRHSLEGCSGELELYLDYYGAELDRLTFVCKDCKAIVGRLDDAVVDEALLVVNELEKGETSE